MRRNNVGVVPLLVSFCVPLFAQDPSSISLPDERLKTDVLVIMAHPDDETAIGSYLVKFLYDEKKSVSVVYCTRGTGGGNSHGREQGRAMGAIREIEARRGLAEMGIMNAWFLEGVDSPGQDVFRSLSNWGHGRIQEDVVRIIRLTRPEVIITWLPGFVAGENHGDHQASGVIATEAFTLAGDPASYPAQIAYPREVHDINNSSEGLAPWSPEKIYYVSDASRTPDLPGPRLDMTEVSPGEGQPYYRIAMAFHRPHLTQGDVSDIALRADRTGDYTEVIAWLQRFRLIFGKATVETMPNSAVFDDLRTVRRSSSHNSANAVSRPFIRLGGPFEFYREFWKTHGIEHLASELPAELEVSFGSYMHVPLLLHNGTPSRLTVDVQPTYPEGWSLVQGGGSYKIEPGENLPVQTFFFAPQTGNDTPQHITWKAFLNGEETGSVSLTVYLKEWTLPQ